MCLTIPCFIFIPQTLTLGLHADSSTAFLAFITSSTRMCNAVGGEVITVGESFFKDLVFFFFFFSLVCVKT